MLLDENLARACLNGRKGLSLVFKSQFPYALILEILLYVEDTETLKLIRQEPAEILQEIQDLEGESAEILNTILELI